MDNKNGYYKGLLELNGFRTPFIVYASSDAHAAEKVMENEICGLQEVTISHLEGPYKSAHAEV